MRNPRFCTLDSARLAMFDTFHGVHYHVPEYNSRVAVVLGRSRGETDAHLVVDRGEIHQPVQREQVVRMAAAEHDDRVHGRVVLLQPFRAEREAQKKRRGYLFYPTVVHNTKIKNVPRYDHLNDKFDNGFATETMTPPKKNLCVCYFS